MALLRIEVLSIEAHKKLHTAGAGEHCFFSRSTQHADVHVERRSICAQFRMQQKCCVRAVK